MVENTFAYIYIVSVKNIMKKTMNLRHSYFYSTLIYTIKLPHPPYTVTHCTVYSVQRDLTLHIHTTSSGTLAGIQRLNPSNSEESYTFCFKS